MKKGLEERLREKGWSEEDIIKTLRIMDSARDKKTDKQKFFDSLVYWIVLIVAIVGNMIISIILIPFLLALRHIQLYMIIVTIAATFGFLFDLLIRDIESLEQKHIIIPGLFIPAIAIINVFFMVRFANHLIALAKVNNIQHNPLIVGMFYTIAFILPYAAYKGIEKFKSQ